jgi:hypothetical protein
MFIGAIYRDIDTVYIYEKYAIIDYEDSSVVYLFDKNLNFTGLKK